MCRIASHGKLATLTFRDAEVKESYFGSEGREGAEQVRVSSGSQIYERLELQVLFSKLAGSKQLLFSPGVSYPLSRMRIESRGLYNNPFRDPGNFVAPRRRAGQ